MGWGVGGDFWTLRWFNFERVAHDGVRYVCSALGRRDIYFKGWPLEMVGYNGVEL